MESGGEREREVAHHGGLPGPVTDQTLGTGIHRRKIGRLIAPGFLIQEGSEVTSVGVGA